MSQYIHLFSKKKDYKELFSFVPCLAYSHVLQYDNAISIVESILSQNSNLLIIDETISQSNIFNIIFALRQKNIENIAKKLPIIVISSDITQSLCEKYINTGANIVLKPPFELAHFEFAVHQLLTMSFESELIEGRFRPVARFQYKNSEPKMNEKTEFETWLV